MSMVDAQIKEAMRKFVAEQGSPVKFEEPWYEGAAPRVSIYGWADGDASEHVHPYKAREQGCEWVIPEGTIIKEETFTQFMGTFADNTEEIGLNAAGISCKCGKYTDVTLRVTSSLGEAIQALLGYDPTTQMVL